MPMVLLLAACVTVPPEPVPAPVEEVHVLIEPAPEPPPPEMAPSTSTSPTPPAEPQIPEDVRQLVELVGYSQRAAQMNPEEQKREVTNATQSFNRDKSNYSRMRLALLLSQPGATVQDDARALALLDPMLNSTGGGTLKQFAGLLHTQLAERAKSQKRADQLKEQLDALRAVERSIIERGQQPPPRKQ